MFSIADFDGLVARNREWAALKSLANGMTPQARGQRLNGFLAEVLRCWGVDARPNQRNLGEIDVAFRIGDQRFILEAKWEAASTDTGALSKLRTRVTQRLAGVLGIFVSIAGYSEEALSELNLGQRSEVLLFDESHVEAILTGFVPPLELFDAALDHAFYTGEPYASLTELVPGNSEIAIEFESPIELQEGLRRCRGASNVAVVASCIPANHLGFVETTDGVLLMTTTSGILEVDVTRRQTRRIVDLSACTRRPLVVGDGVVFLRHNGVGKFEKGRVSPIAGPFRGSSTLVPTSDGTWVFSNGDLQSRAELTALGGIGCESRHEIPYDGANSRDALWLEDRKFAVTGNMGTLVVDLCSGEYKLTGGTGAAPNEDGVLRLSATELLVASDGARLWRHDLSTGTFELEGEIPLPGSGHSLERALRHTGYISTPLLGKQGETAILRFDLAS